jgi:5-methylcytosine-specific restriction endonuclease McrA
MAKQRERRAERARKRGVKREPYTMAEIAARDRYRCGICIAEGRGRHARAAMTKAVPHLKAPTIDHVVPLAAGGDDTRANVQLAHYGCNTRKWIRGSQQLAMIG